MNVLITGGAGFIGSHLARALLGAGHQVILYDNLHPQVHRQPPTHLPKRAELIVADVRDRRALATTVQRAEAIFHLAALTGVGQSMYQIAEYTDVNVGGTATLLDVLANGRHPVRRLVLASSRAVYGEGAYRCPQCGPVPVTGRNQADLKAGVWDPRCPNCTACLQTQPTPEDHVPLPGSVYAAGKLAQEHLVRSTGMAYNLETVILRFFNVYGPGQSLSNPYTGILSTFFSRLQAGKPIEVYEDGQESRDFVYVTDAVQAGLLALDRPHAAGHTFNVGTGRATTVLEVAQTIARLAGQPDNLYISHRFRVGDIRHCYADTGRAERLLGYSPQVSLAQGLDSFLTWASTREAIDRSDQAEQELVGHGLFHGKGKGP